MDVQSHKKEIIDTCKRSGIELNAQTIHQAISQAEKNQAALEPLAAYPHKFDTLFIHQIENELSNQRNLESALNQLLRESEE